MNNTRPLSRTNVRNHPLELIVACSCLILAMLVFSGCEEEMEVGQAPPLNEANLTDPATKRSIAVQAVRDGLTDQSPIVRSNAIEVVVKTRLTRLLPAVQKLMNDATAPVRFAAVVAVGDLEYALAQSEVEQLLRDPDPNVRLAASYAMAKLGSPEYGRVLYKAITSKDQTVRANAALLLGKMGDPAALKELYAALTADDSADKVVYQAAESIARLGDERIYPKLWTMLISAYADVRVMGVLSMGLLGNNDAKDALVGMLDDDVLEVRLAAAKELGTLGERIGEPQVLAVFEKDLLADLGKAERQRAAVLTALAIGEIGSPGLTRHLTQMLQDQFKLIRLAAAKAILQTTPAQT